MRKLLLVIRLQILDRQRVDVGSRRVQPPCQWIENVTLVLPRDFRVTRFADKVPGQYYGVRATWLVVLRGWTQQHSLGFLAIRADHTHDEYTDLPAVRQALVRLGDSYRDLVVGLCNWHDMIGIVISL